VQAGEGGQVPCRSAGSVGWLSHGFSLVMASKSRLPASSDNTKFHKDGAAGTGPGRDGGLRDPNPRRPGPAASHADGSRRSVVRADTIDPVAVAPRRLNWRHPPLAWDEETF
jgi:hypothetical protein